MSILYALRLQRQREETQLITIALHLRLISTAIFAALALQPPAISVRFGRDIAGISMKRDNFEQRFCISAYIPRGRGGGLRYKSDGGDRRTF